MGVVLLENGADCAHYHNKHVLSFVGSHLVWADAHLPFVNNTQLEVIPEEDASTFLRTEKLQRRLETWSKALRPQKEMQAQRRLAEATQVQKSIQQTTSLFEQTVVREKIRGKIR